MLRRIFGFPALALVACLALGGCWDDDSSSNKSGQTTVTAASSDSHDDATTGSDFDSNPADAPRINVKLVQEALAQVQKTDPNGWVEDFRARVNEIYDGDDVISIDAHPNSGNNLEIVGYISKSGKDGYQADTDEQIFMVEQTGTAVNDQTPYRMTYSTYDGSSAYYDGYYHNPFLTAWYVNATLGHSWGGYYTSPAHITVIQTVRTSYRATPAYVQEREATHAYYAQTYHGSIVKSTPGSSLATGVSIKKGAPAVPSHVSEPPAFTPHATMPHKTPDASHSGSDLEHRAGGLFNKCTYSCSGKTSTGGSKPSSSKPSRSGHK